MINCDFELIVFCEFEKLCDPQFPKYLNSIELLVVSEHYDHKFIERVDEIGHKRVMRVVYFTWI